MNRTKKGASLEGKGIKKKGKKREKDQLASRFKEIFFSSNLNEAPRRKTWREIFLLVYRF